MPVFLLTRGLGTAILILFQEVIDMACTQQMQLVAFPRVRVQKKWFRYFNDHKSFRNDGSVHLFSLMALFSYANFRSNTRSVGTQSYLEGPGQWVCKLSALPRILRVRSKAQAMGLLDWFQAYGFLRYEVLDESIGLLRYTIADWQRHCVHLEYNYYSYKGSGFFFFPLPVGRQLLSASRREGKIIFSELDAIMDFWLHTILNDATVAGSEYMPVVYYSNMKGQPLLSYSFLAKRWGWSKSRVGRFILKIEESGIISRVSFTSSHGSVISPCRYREMIYGDDCEKLQLTKIGEILGLTSLIAPDESVEELEMKVQTRVPNRPVILEGGKLLRIQIFRPDGSSFFARPVPLVFYSSLDWGRYDDKSASYCGPPELWQRR